MIWTGKLRAYSLLTAATVLLLAGRVFAERQEIDRARKMYDVPVSGYTRTEAAEGMLSIHSRDTLQTTDRKYKVTVTPGEGGKGNISLPIKLQCGKNDLTVRVGTNEYTINPPQVVVGKAKELVMVFTVTASTPGTPCSCQPPKVSHDWGVEGMLVVDGPGGTTSGYGRKSKQTSVSVKCIIKGTNLLAGLYKIYANAGAWGYHGAPSGLNGRFSAKLDKTLVGGSRHEGPMDACAQWSVCPWWHVGTVVIHKDNVTGAYLVKDHREEIGGCVIKE